MSSSESKVHQGLLIRHGRRRGMYQVLYLSFSSFLTGRQAAWRSWNTVVQWTK